MSRFTRSIVAVSVFFFLAQVTLQASTIKFDGGTLNLKNVHKSTYSGSGVLASPAVYRVGKYSYKLKQGGEVKFNPKYNYVKSAVLADPIRVRIGKYSMSLEPGKKVEFNRTYKGEIYLSAAYIRHRVKIRIRSRFADVKGRVAWHSSGEVMAAELVNDTKIKRGKYDFWYAKNSRIYLSSSGELDSGYFRKAGKIRIGKNNILVRGKDWGVSSITFGYKGDILSLAIDKDQSVKVGNKEYKAKKDSVIIFHNDGAVKSLRVAEKTETGKGTALKGYKIDFLANGDVKKVSR